MVLNFEAYYAIRRGPGQVSNDRPLPDNSSFGRNITNVGQHGMTVVSDGPFPGSPSTDVPIVKQLDGTAILTTCPRIPDWVPFKGGQCTGGDLRVAFHYHYNDTYVWSAGYHLD